MVGMRCWSKNLIWRVIKYSSDFPPARHRITFKPRYRRCSELIRGSVYLISTQLVAFSFVHWWLILQGGWRCRRRKTTSLWGFPIRLVKCCTCLKIIYIKWNCSSAGLYSACFGRVWLPISTVSYISRYVLLNLWVHYNNKMISEWHADQAGVNDT